MIKQFVPSEVCLKCLGCCRFKEEDSVWSPCLTDEEVQGLIDKDIPKAYLASGNKLKLKQNKNSDGFSCPFLKEEGNACAIYAGRPFECQLYPFLLNLRLGKAVLTVDLNCPYVREKISAPEFKEYVLYLAEFLNTPLILRLLKDNPQLLAAYEDVLKILELEIPRQ